MHLLNINNIAAPAKLWEIEFKRCYAYLDSAARLIIGNTLIERSWQVKDGLLSNQSLRDLNSDSAIEWLDTAVSQPTIYPPVDLLALSRLLSFAATTGQHNVTEEPSLLVILTVQGEELNLIYRFQIFPTVSGITQQFLIEKASLTNSNNLTVTTKAENLGSIYLANSVATGVEVAFDSLAKNKQKLLPLDLLEYFSFKTRHLRLIQITLLDQTDERNEIVFENEWLLHSSEKLLTLTGNLFVIENTLTGAGLILLKLAPLPPARPFQSTYDLLYEGSKNSLSFTGHNIAGTDFEDACAEGYRFVTLTYSNGRFGRIEALQNYQRHLRSYEPARDGLFFSNTWGDRSRDARITQAFMQQEIKTAVTLGVDVVQIDDGWQAGRTANSVEKSGVWEGFWQSNANFWQPHPQRLPAGLAPLVKQARENGIELGLWFGADSAHDFANWQQDADKLLELYKELGIKFFKIDAIKMLTKVGERNLHQFFQRVLEQSVGQVVLELDTTADIRPGYFGMFNSGPIFVENRYTDWHNYWPHQTLRNFWKLAHYIDPLRLRMEFLNNARNTQLYPADPLAPAMYSPAYLFATTMLANPLGFFEISNLPATYVQEVSRLVKIWKAHRRAIWQGRIFPVGHTPDGTSWTGFIAIGQDRQSGYAVIFRELNAISTWVCSLPIALPGHLKTEILWGTGSAKVNKGQLEIKIMEPQDFIFVKFQKNQTKG